MTRLRIDPYNLVYNNLVQAIVSAQNINGWSEFSLPNSVGATIQVEPQAMPAPTKGALTL